MRAPPYLDSAVDARLQAYLQATVEDLRTLHSRAIVATLLATGITVAEARSARLADVSTHGSSACLCIPAHGPRGARTVPLPEFAVLPLSDWLERRRTLPIDNDRLFTLTTDGRPIADETFGRIVAAALEAIGCAEHHTSPRTLRNTFCRRHLMAGYSTGEVTQMLGLTSQRTCNRIAATIPCMETLQ
ncbi:site-specific tyrosine recombinase XerC [compost metagenome]